MNVDFPIPLSSFNATFQADLTPAAATAGVATTTSSATGSLLLSYFGGPVVSNIEVTPIWYDSTAPFQSQMMAYYDLLTSSSFMDIYKEYATPTQIIGKGSVVGSYTEKGPIKMMLDDDLDIQPYLRNLISTGVLTPNANSYYPIHLKYGVNVSSSGLGYACSAFAGYHTSLYVGDISLVQYVYYGVIPQCSTRINDLWSPVSHELAETITDPIPGRGWYHTVEGEISDICAWQEATIADSSGKAWIVQKQWSNSLQKCVIAPAITTAQVAPVIASPSPQYLTKKSGVLMTNVEITPVFYGSSISFQSNISSFYSFIATSSYMDIVAEYGIGKGKMLTPYFETNYKTKLDLSTDMTAYLRNLVSTGKLQPNKNSYYPIHLASDVDLIVNGLSICPNYCAFSGWIYIGDIYKNASYLSYGMIPDLTGSCKEYCGYSPQPLRNTQALSSVHLIRSITNTLRNGWQSTTGEPATGMNCSWKQYPIVGPNSTVITVQKLWSNTHQSCIGALPTTSASRNATNATTTTPTTTTKTTTTQTTTTKTTTTKTTSTTTTTTTTKTTTTRTTSTKTTTTRTTSTKTTTTKTTSTKTTTTKTTSTTTTTNQIKSASTSGGLPIAKSILTKCYPSFVITSRYIDGNQVGHQGSNYRLESGTWTAITACETSVVPQCYPTQSVVTTTGATIATGTQSSSKGINYVYDGTTKQWKSVGSCV
ncbi:hypothetical protein BDR26DRAFT_1015258 [Obelidium mucronatum]|nr:hypothetical protein BDR26DRAFT_1015258 [Obelidium mucronatum]